MFVCLDLGPKLNYFTLAVWVSEMLMEPHTALERVNVATSATVKKHLLSSCLLRAPYALSQRGTAQLARSF